MPIWLRRFTFESLKEHYGKQQEAMEKQQNILKNKSSKEIAKPNISSPAPPTPTYIAKAPKK
jgi:hypothetical protein